MTVHGYRRDVSEMVRRSGSPGLPRGVSRPPHPLLLALMSVVVPGTGHIYAGHRRIGAVILAVFGCIVTLAVGIVLVTPPEHLLAGTVRPAWLVVIMVACGVLALSLVLVILDAYRLGRPRRLPVPQRVVGRVVMLGLCAALVAPLAVLASYANVQRGLISDVFPDRAEPPVSGAATQWTGAGRLNVLLLGGDGAKSRPGIRADSVTVASFDTLSGNTVLFSLPRNLQHVHFPAGTPAAEHMPDGFSDFFFGVYTWGADNPGLFKGSKDPGSSAVASAASSVLGIPIHYYVRVNMRGFRQMINTLGGVRLRVQDPVPIGGGIGADGKPNPVVGYVRPGLRTLNGFEALWYARSRADSDDYVRMGRQRCVLGALARQADPLSVLRHYRELAAETKQAVATNIPKGVLPDLVQVAAKLQNAKITSLQFVPPMIDPAQPDVHLIQKKVAKAIWASENPPQRGAKKNGKGDGRASNVEKSCVYQ